MLSPILSEVQSHSPCWPKCGSEDGGTIVVVLTLTHRYNAVRGHKAGSNNSGAEDYSKQIKTEDDAHNS